MDWLDFKLSKRDFRDIRELLSIALEREFVQGLEQVEDSIARWRKEKPVSAREHYHELLSGLKEHRKRLAMTYDGLSKVSMKMLVPNLLYEKILTDEDMELMRPETREYFRYRLKQVE